MAEDNATTLGNSAIDVFKGLGKRVIFQVKNVTPAKSAAVSSAPLNCEE